MCLVLMSRMTRRQSGPVILQEFFSHICALTGRAARHDTKKYFLRQHFPKKSSLGVFATNSFVLVFCGGIIARYVAKLGITQMRLCVSKYRQGVSHLMGDCGPSLIWGIAAIVSQYRAIRGH